MSTKQLKHQNSLRLIEQNKHIQSSESLNRVRRRGNSRQGEG